MEKTLFVLSKLTFTVCSRCLNFPLWILWPAISWEEWSLLRYTSSAKSKHLKYSENVNFEWTSNVVSILIFLCYLMQQIQEFKKFFTSDLWSYSVYFAQTSLIVTNLIKPQSTKSQQNFANMTQCSEYWLDFATSDMSFADSKTTNAAFQPILSKQCSKGAFNNYVDRRGWVGGQANVFAYKVNDLFLFTLFVYEGCWSKRSKNLTT